jgi:hypothetical protein
MCDLEFKSLQPDFNKPIYISCFDDGTEKMKYYENVWYIVGSWREKVRLLNKNKITEILSISAWKVQPIMVNDD